MSRHDRPSKPEDFRRRLRTALVTGPIHGMTVRITSVSPRDFIDLGIIPGLFAGETDPEKRKRLVSEEIAKSCELQERVTNRILIRGILEPRVVAADEEIDDPMSTISVRELGADIGYFAEKILELSGISEAKKIGPFRRLSARLFGRRTGAQVREASERTAGGESR